MGAQSARAHGLMGSGPMGHSCEGDVVLLFPYVALLFLLWPYYFFVWLLFPCVAGPFRIARLPSDLGHSAWFWVQPIGSGLCP